MTHDSWLDRLTDMGLLADVACWQIGVCGWPFLLSNGHTHSPFRAGDGIGSGNNWYGKSHTSHYRGDGDFMSTDRLADYRLAMVRQLLDSVNGMEEIR